MTVRKDDPPLQKFKKKLDDFAKGEKRGIRNPFVIVPVEPQYERLLGKKLKNWAKKKESEKINIRIFELDKLLPKTTVFKIMMSFSSTDVESQEIEDTLRDNLGQEIASLIKEDIKEISNESETIVLLLNLGSLYPFTRASELLDEFDRLKVKATIGIPFPGEVIGGKLSFFGVDARLYYPAHRIEEQIEGGHLND